ncbi:MAG: hypothetical protein Q4C68_01240 [Moraxella sp.]|nr:hypothetical protein [Moraxella sp.]
MPGLPRKNSEFLTIYRKDIEEIIKPYGFEYEDRDEYYESVSWSAKQRKETSFLFFKKMPYGKIYLTISSTGRLSEFRVHAFFYPAIIEVANISKKVYSEQIIKPGTNALRWHDGVDGIKLDLISNTHIMRDNELYEKTLMDISTNLDIYMSLTSPRKLFEFYKKRPNFYSFDFRFPGYTRLGYWLIMAKLAGEDYYAELADEYVEINQEKIQKEFNVDITQLKEFLDTYTVGSLA